MVKITANAIRLFHSIPYSPIALYILTVRGYRRSVLIKVRAPIRSPHPQRKVNAAETTMPGYVMGTMTLQNTWNRPHPSIIAASSSSFGISRKYGRSVMIQKGILCRQVKITGAARVSNIAIFLNVIKRGERNSTVGSICVIRIASSTARLILSLKRARPYADRVASSVDMTVG